MNRITELRQKHKIKQIDLADTLGWHQSRLSNYESGLRTPSLDVSRQIVKALRDFGVDCTLDDVFPPKHKGQAA